MTADADQTTFRTSFEASDPTPTWTDTIDTGTDGRPRSHGATMRTHPGNGPVQAPTARPGVGFTGVKALRYHGSHRGDGPAQVVNKIFWVELAVTEDTELSYLIFPEYPNTHVA